MTASESSDVQEGEAPAEIEPVLAEFRRHFPAGDHHLILRAFATARRAHEGQVRRTGPSEFRRRYRTLTPAEKAEVAGHADPIDNPRLRAAIVALGEAVLSATE